MTMYLIFSWNNIPIDNDDIIPLFYVLYYIYVGLMYIFCIKYCTNIGKSELYMYLTDVTSAVSNIAPNIGKSESTYSF